MGHCGTSWKSGIFTGTVLQVNEGSRKQLDLNVQLTRHINGNSVIAAKGDIFCALYAVRLVHSETSFNQPE